MVTVFSFGVNADCNIPPVEAGCPSGLLHSASLRSATALGTSLGKAVPALASTGGILHSDGTPLQTRLYI